MKKNKRASIKKKWYEFYSINGTVKRVLCMREKEVSDYAANHGFGSRYKETKAPKK
jgi:hypothetical protein